MPTSIGQTAGGIQNFQGKPPPSMVLGPSNDYYAINPATGQYERVYYEMNVPYTDPESGPQSITDFYFESDRPSTATRHTYQDDRSDIVLPIVKAGLGTLVGMAAGPVAGGALNSIWQSEGEANLGSILKGAAAGFAGGQV